MKYYLAVWADTHSDDEYALFRSKELAIARCKEWEATYQDEFIVEEQNHIPYLATNEFAEAYTCVEIVELEDK